VRLLRVKVVDKDGYWWVVEGKSLAELKRKVIRLLMKRKRGIESNGVRCKVIVKREGSVFGWLSCWRGKRGWDQVVVVFECCADARD